MSVCSVSDRFVLLASRRARLGLACWALLLAPLALPATAAAAKDEEARSVRRVRVSDSGIVIDETVRDTIRIVDEGEDDSDATDVRTGDLHIRVDDDGDDVVRVFDNAHVAAGDHINGSVVAVFGSVTVEGTVDGDVVAVLGSVRLRDGAEVGGEVVSVGGSLDQSPDARVHGESVSVSFMPMSWGLPGLPVMLGCIVAGWLASIAIGWMFAALFPNRFVRVAATSSRRTAASLLVGLLSIPAFFLLLVLLFVTVIGIPLALVLPPAFLLLSYAGQMAATYVLGTKLTGRSVGSGRDLMLPLLAGSLIVAACFGAAAILYAVPGLSRPVALFFSALGGLLVFCLTTIGTGAFLLSRFGTRPSDVVWGSADPFPAPPQPYPGVPPAASANPTG